MSKEPHLVPPTKGLSYVMKKDVKAKMVTIADSQREDRGMDLIIQKSRAVIKGHIHEAVVTEDPKAGPGKAVNSVAYLGMMEITVAGLIVIGDDVFTNGVKIGEVIGFDETHFPNHMNILIRVKKLSTGFKMGLKLGSCIRFSLKSNIKFTG